MQLIPSYLNSSISAFVGLGLAETRASGVPAVTSDSQFGGRWFARVAPCQTSLLVLGRRSILPDRRPFFSGGVGMFDRWLIEGAV